MFRAIAVLALGSLISTSAQITTGILDVIAGGRGAEPTVPVTVTGPPGLSIRIAFNSSGEARLVLPYGDYVVRGGGFEQRVHVEPLKFTRCVLGGENRIPEIRSPPQTFSAAAALLMKQPEIITEPLDLTGLENNRLALISYAGKSWTTTRYRLQGIDAADSYQPGIPLVLADPLAIEEPARESGINFFARNADSSWHGALATSDTGSGLVSDNLPQPAGRGNVRQPQSYRWFTNDHAETGGPVTRWADVFLSGSSQWASQTVEQARLGDDLNSRLLFGNARGRVRLSSKDQLDAQYTGSRIDLSGWGFPAGIQALTGRRLGPSLYGIGGFPDLAEVDHLDFVQFGWTRMFPTSSESGALQVRYGYSTAHLDTRPNRTLTGASVTELTNPTGESAPLWNLAVRTRHDLEAAYEPGEIGLAHTRHRISLGGGWQTARPRNRFEAPLDENVITAAGVPAFLVQLNTPLDSRESIESFSPFLVDHVTVNTWLSLDAGLSADVSRGGLPAQSSPAGWFSPARRFPARPSLISWNSLAPRFGLALRVPHASGLVLRGSYARFEQPLAGRYLDFANPNSIGSQEYSAITGQLLRRFGGPYASIAPSLRRPYTDRFAISAEASLPWNTTAGVRLSRSDEKDRIAAVDTGVPFEDYSPEQIDDPGPDFIPGTFDDQKLVAYAQNPSTFGRDRYLLTNPPGLRDLNEALLVEASTSHRFLGARAAFVAMKSFGPTNPGNSVWENDPGIIGALFGDPNTLVNATGHSFLDRAYAGKLEADSRLPTRLGGLEVASIVNYFDGLPFARQLLVTGLPQGPFELAATIRGSPEGGNRSQYVLNWNIRVSRNFRLRFGKLLASADVFNLLNANRSIAEQDFSGPQFNQRLPIAIQPAQFVRISVGYGF